MENSGSTLGQAGVASPGISWGDHPGVNRGGPEGGGPAAVVYICEYFYAPICALFLGLQTCTCRQ